VEAGLLPDQRKSQAGTFGPGGIATLEAFEDSLALVGRDPRAVVVDLDQDVFSVFDQVPWLTVRASDR